MPAGTAATDGPQEADEAGRQGVARRHDGRAELADDDAVQPRRRAPDRGQPELPGRHRQRLALQEAAAVADGRRPRRRRDGTVRRPAGRRVRGPVRARPPPSADAASPKPATASSTCWTSTSPARFRPPAGHPLHDILLESFGDQTVEQRLVLLGVRLVPAVDMSGGFGSRRARLHGVADLGRGPAGRVQPRTSTGWTPSCAAPVWSPPATPMSGWPTAGGTSGSYADTPMMAHHNHTHLFGTVDAAVRATRQRAGVLRGLGRRTRCPTSGR